MRSISFALTEPQFLDGSKTVTRRLGWLTLKPGTLLQGVRKGMGLKKGEKAHKLGVIRVVSVRRERLDAITAQDCAREGFPELAPLGFVAFFCASHADCKPDAIITRIEFEHVKDTR